MTRMTSRMASARVLATSRIDSRMKSVLSTGKTSLKPGGKVGSIAKARPFTASTSLSALAPGAGVMAIPAAGWPFIWPTMP